MSANPPAVLVIPAHQLALLTGCLQHMARQLEAGCALSGQRAELLLEHLAQAQALPDELRQACAALHAALPPAAATRACA